MVVITDPESAKVADQDILRMLFRLTASEATLARLLAEGATLNEAASVLEVSAETVRKRIKAVFDKTGTHRQAELVALIINSSAGLPR
jgi:DNA-binding CsgD family transcriptional regulator